MSAHCFTESFAAEIATQDVILDFTRFAAVRVPGHSQRVTDGLDPRPLFLKREVCGDFGQIIRSFINPSVRRIACFEAAILEVFQIVFKMLSEMRFDGLA